jgi:hypothetical protein
MDKPLLSKSSFIRGLQCLKSLYYYKNFYSLRDKPSDKRQAIFSRGINIGVIAQGLFPGGKDASASHPSRQREAAENTQRLIAEGHTIIYEAAFIYQQVYVAVDMLVKTGEEWQAYEVKSATRISEAYLNDAAIQSFVIRGAGIPLSDFSLVYVNNQYIRRGPLDLQGLFTRQSVAKEIEKRLPEIEANLIRAKMALAKREVPDIQIGEHCFSPYDCDFWGTCSKGIPADSVFELSGVNREEQFRLFHQGFKKLEEIQINPAMSRDLQIQIKTSQSKEIYIEKENVLGYINTLKYPLIFLDFETFMPAVPIYENSKPYEQIPFQFSAHILDEGESEPIHKEFLAEHGIDPRREFLEQVLSVTAGAGTILAYNASFEATVLRYLGNLFPEFSEQVKDRISRFSDLMMPFKQKWYYHHAMKGSASIKNVLPALVPEMDYATLSIGNGALAMAKYESLTTSTDLFEIAQIREDLLEYCKMDTLAMVKILQVLLKIKD